MDDPPGVNPELLWSSRALADLEEIRSYYDQNRPAALANIQAKLLAAMDLLARFPASGQVVFGLADGRRYRRMVAGAYHLYYRLQGANVFVVRVWDARRGEPDLDP